MRLVLAARLSKLQANGDQGLGIETQDKRAQDWAGKNGHDIIAVAADTKSGTTAPWDRPSLRPWVTDTARMGTYDGILAYRNDRLSRGCWSDEARIRLWAEEHGKALVIVDGPTWPPRHDGDRWSWEAMSMQARKEWEETRERTMRAQDELRERGKLVGRPPFGLTSEGEKYDRQLVPTETGRTYVPQIFARVIAGESLADIAVWLDSQLWQGIPFPYPQTWARTIGQVIRNPVYIGHRVDSSGKTIHRCEPLVDARTFRLAGEALDSRPKRGPVNEATRAMLSRALFCPSCADSPMNRIYCPTTRNGEKVKLPYYRCQGRGSQRKGCGNMVPLSKVDDAVNEIIAATFDTPVMVSRLIPGHDHGAELEDVRFEMRQLAAQDLSDSEFDARMTELRAHRDYLASLPSVPDRVEEVPTGQSWAALWGTLPQGKRGDWLRSQGFRVTADKGSVTVSQGTKSASVALKSHPGH